MCRRLSESRGNKPEIVVVEQGHEPDKFWISLGSAGGKHFNEYKFTFSEIRSEREEEKDDEYERKLKQHVKLFWVSDSSGAVKVRAFFMYLSIKVTLKSNPPLKQSMLDTNDCFCLDIGTELFVWFGKGCTVQVTK